MLLRFALVLEAHGAPVHLVRLHAELPPEAFGVIWSRRRNDTEQNFKSDQIFRLRLKQKHIDEPHNGEVNCDLFLQSSLLQRTRISRKMQERSWRTGEP